jgi:hypothetical protein
MKRVIKKFGQYLNENMMGDEGGQTANAVILYNEQDGTLEVNFNPSAMHDYHGYEDAVRDEGVTVLFVKIDPEVSSIRWRSGQLDLQEVTVIKEMTPDDLGNSGGWNEDDDYGRGY